METWEKQPLSSPKGHRRQPSFSSTLLDQIYRSIDDSPPLESTRKKKQQCHDGSLHQDCETSPNKLVFHRRSVAADFERSRRIPTADSVFLRCSNFSSSDSSGFFSSESDSLYGRPKTRQPKPIRTSVEKSDQTGGVQRPNSKQDLGGFLRTKSKALKIYTDLKKMKQPISPGGRLATFLNSLFTNAASNPKKPKKTNTAAEPQSASSTTTTTTTSCSSVSSFSRSCLSKTPTSSGKSKRSVKFCPVNVILDEDSSVHIPYGSDNRQYRNNNDTKRDRYVMEEENRRVIEAAKDLIRTYQKNKDHLAMTTCDDVANVEDEDDDDAASYASSDLFELENLSAIGIERYREELPVYETTRFDNTNRPIATS